MANNLFKPQNDSTISRLLEDLTTLEINTIIKPGMTAAQPPDSVEELVQQLVEGYKERMAHIIKANTITREFKFQEAKSVKELHDQLDEFNQFLKDDHIWLVDNDYIRLLRMQSFCHYIFAKSRGGNAENTIVVKTYNGGGVKTAYDVDLSNLDAFRFIMDARDRVKLQKLYDLGSENIVMQTRFSISGDVVTRIEEGFALSPKQVIIDIHEQHTNLSVNYWKSLVEIVKDIVSGIFHK